MDWYYSDNGRQAGPVTDAEIEALVRAGKIQPDTLVWHPGMKDWQPYQNAVAPAPRGADEKAAGKPAFVQRPEEGAAAIREELQYAGFWIRFGAVFIDGIILAVFNMMFGFAAALVMTGSESATGLMQFLQFVVGLAYVTFFLGKFGATPGKMACGLRVVTPDGGRISYARAFGRHFGTLLSSILLCIGYLMVVFDDEKRALHDRVCGTRVIRKPV